MYSQCIGPKTDPWGTPYSVTSFSDSVQPYALTMSYSWNNLQTSEVLPLCLLLQTFLQVCAEGYPCEWGKETDIYPELDDGKYSSNITCPREHVKRAIYQAGHIWGQTLIGEPQFPSPANGAGWDWKTIPSGLNAGPLFQRQQNVVKNSWNVRARRNAL